MPDSQGVYCQDRFVLKWRLPGGEDRAQSRGVKRWSCSVFEYLDNRLYLRDFYRHRSVRNSSKRFHPHRLHARGLLGAFGVVLSVTGGCTGTESGNPAPLLTTACKSADGYQSLDAALPHREFEHRQKSDADKVGVPELRPSQGSLGPLARVPVWLECVEWAAAEGALTLQIANFSGGCEVDWEGGARLVEVQPGQARLVLELANGECAVASCGSCTYDLRLEDAIALPEGTRELLVELVRKDCKGKKGRTTEYAVALGSSPQGMSCQAADEWGASKAAQDRSDFEAEYWAPCGAVSGGEPSSPLISECATELTCVAGRCVAICSGDEDCPLGSAERCVEGTCALSAQ